MTVCHVSYDELVIRESTLSGRAGLCFGLGKKCGLCELCSNYNSAKVGYITPHFEGCAVKFDQTIEGKCVNNINQTFHSDGQSIKDLRDTSVSCPGHRVIATQIVHY